MEKINRDLIKRHNWKQCSFCQNVCPTKPGTKEGNDSLPRVDESGLCENCKKYALET